MRGVYCESGASRSLIKIGVAEKAAPFFVLFGSRREVRPITRKTVSPTSRNIPVIILIKEI